MPDRRATRSTWDSPSPRWATPHEIATEPHHRIAAPQRLTAELRHRAIPGRRGVTEAIVGRLEVIDVEQRHGRRLNARVSSSVIVMRRWRAMSRSGVATSAKTCSHRRSVAPKAWFALVAARTPSGPSESRNGTPRKAPMGPVWPSFATYRGSRSPSSTHTTRGHRTGRVSAARRQAPREEGDRRTSGADQR